MFLPNNGRNHGESQHGSLIISNTRFANLVTWVGNDCVGNDTHEENGSKDHHRRTITEVGALHEEKKRKRGAREMIKVTVRR